VVGVFFTHDIDIRHFNQIPGISLIAWLIALLILFANFILNRK
jgi:hypothetical protein